MNDSDAADPPRTRAQVRARLQEAAAIDADVAPTAPYDPARMFDPMPATVTTEPPVDTNPFTAALREPVPAPSTERPSFVGEPSFVGAAGRFEIETLDAPRTTTTTNGPAKAALVLILVALLGGFAAFGLAISGHEQIGGVVFLVVGGLFAAALLLAIAGLVLAIRRPTRKTEAVFALVVSLLAVLGIGWRLLSGVLGVS